METGQSYSLAVYDAVIKTLQLAVVIVGGVWAYLRLRAERTHTPHLDFSVDCTFFGPINDHYVANVVLCIENKGVVMQQLHDLTLSIRGLQEKDTISPHRPKQIDQAPPYSEYRVSFPHLIPRDAPVPIADETVRV